jgi:DNA-binding MarR family transcriptional regulator
MATSPATSSGASADDPRPGVVAVDFDADASLLVDLLKLATFIGTPMREGVADPLGLTATDLRVILALGGEGELAGHDLSEIMGVPPMNVSRALASLLERKLVEPGHDPANRRRKPFRLTGAGADVFRRTAPALTKVGSNLFAGVSPEDRESFHRAAQAVIARMTARS